MGLDMPIQVGGRADGKGPRLLSQNVDVGVVAGLQNLDSRKLFVLLRQADNRAPRA
jgi:hypothetical protein